MARSFAARLGSSAWPLPIGRLSRPRIRSLRPALSRLASPKRFAVALAVLAVLGGGWLWLRNSSLVAVERVQIDGVQGVDAGPIDAALQAAAKRMSTLNFNAAALRAAVARWRVVGSVSVDTSFPHSVRIEVVERLPVAAVSAAGIHTAMAADGTVLGPELLAAVHGELPSIALAGVPPSPGDRVGNVTARAELRVLGAAPRALLGWMAKVYMGREGLTVGMRNGVEIYFGDATRPHAKWLAAVRVLADARSAGATYVDVLAPERPAAGTTAAGGLSTDGAANQVSASDPTSAALASALAEAVNGGSSTSGASSTLAAPANPEPSAETSEQSLSTSG